MTFTRDMTEFVLLNRKDLVSIINTKFRSTLDLIEMQDLLQNIYLSMLENKTLERFDDKRGVKFSTFIYLIIAWTCQNIKAYYRTGKNDGKTTSLDEMCNLQSDNVNPNEKIYVEQFIKYLEELPNNKSYRNNIKKSVILMDCLEDIDLSVQAKKYGISVAGICGKMDVIGKDYKRFKRRCL